MKAKSKQSGRKKKANEVLQKYKVAIDDFVKSKSASEDVDHGSDFKYVKKKSRKELRKEKRKLKKAKMKSHYEGKTDVTPPQVANKTPPVQENRAPKKNKSERKDTPDKVAVKKPSKSTQKLKKTDKLQESRKQALLEANEQEDKEIKRLERSLGLNKRKNKKSLPQSFMADGLDYILGVLDSGSSGAAMYDSEDDMDLAKDNFSKLEEEEESAGSDDEEVELQMSSDEEDSTGSLGEDNDSHEDIGDEEEAVESEGDLNESDGEEGDESMASEAEEGDDAVVAQVTEENTEVWRISH